MGSFGTSGRGLSAAVGLDAYSLSVVAINPSWVSAATEVQAVVIP